MPQGVGVQVPPGAPKFETEPLKGSVFFEFELRFLVLNIIVINFKICLDAGLTWGYPL